MLVSIHVVCLTLKLFLFVPSDASFYEKQLDQGRETKVAKQELGYIIRDIEDASRILRMAKAERDAAMNKLDRLKSKHWALLSEYDAARSFELD
jgi:hypothetical protein